MRRISMQWLLMMAVAHTSTAARAEFIVNGGFELPVVTGSAALFAAGDPSITGWTIVSGSVDVVNQSFFPPFAGKQSLDLDGVTAGTIEQTFATTAGSSYFLSFAYANNPIGGTNPAMATVGLFDTGGSPLLNQAITHSMSTVSAMNYNLFTTSFTADSATTRLRFTSTDPTNSVGGIVLDAVSVNTPASPEPASLILMGIGMLGVFSWSRRR